MNVTLAESAAAAESVWRRAVYPEGFTMPRGPVVTVSHAAAGSVSHAGPPSTAETTYLEQNPHTHE